MLKVWIVGLVLAIIFLVVAKFLDYGDDDNFYIVLTAIVPVLGVLMSIYCIIEMLEDCNLFKSYKQYSDKLHYFNSYKTKKIYLTAKQIRKFLAVNPSKWKITNQGLLIYETDSAVFLVAFKNPIDYYMTKALFERESRKGLKNKSHDAEPDKNMREFLICVQQDIDDLKKQSEQYIEEVKQNIEMARGQL